MAVPTSPSSSPTCRPGQPERSRRTAAAPVYRKGWPRDRRTRCRGTGEGIGATTRLTTGESGCRYRRAVLAFITAGLRGVALTLQFAWVQRPVRQGRGTHANPNPITFALRQSFSFCASRPLAWHRRPQQMTNSRSEPDPAATEEEPVGTHRAGGHRLPAGRRRSHRAGLQLHGRRDRGTRRLDAGRVLPHLAVDVSFDNDPDQYQPALTMARTRRTNTSSWGWASRRSTCATWARRTRWC